MGEFPKNKAHAIGNSIKIYDQFGSQEKGFWYYIFHAGI